MDEPINPSRRAHEIGSLEWSKALSDAQVRLQALLGDDVLKADPAARIRQVTALMDEAVIDGLIAKRPHGNNDPEDYVLVNDSFRAWKALDLLHNYQRAIDNAKQQIEITEYLKEGQRIEQEKRERRAVIEAVQAQLQEVLDDAAMKADSILRLQTILALREKAVEQGLAVKVTSSDGDEADAEYTLIEGEQLSDQIRDLLSALHAALLYTKREAEEEAVRRHRLAELIRQRQAALSRALGELDEIESEGNPSGRLGKLEILRRQAISEEVIWPRPDNFLAIDPEGEEFARRLQAAFDNARYSIE